MSEPSAAQKIETARQRVAELDGQLADLAGRRRALLLAGAPASEVGKFDLELDRLKREQATEQERIEGLAEEIRAQEVKATIARKNKQIERNAKKLAASLDDAKELEATIGKAIEIFHRICKARSELMPTFRLGDPEVDAALANPEGAALTPSSIATCLAWELFRQGARPITVLGAPIVEPSWPRPVPPRLEWAATPEKVKPFTDAIARANDYALSLMRDGRAPALLAASQVGTDVRTEAQVQLAELLKKQMELAQDPERESEYMELIEQVAVLQSRVDAERVAISKEAAATEKAERPQAGSAAQRRLAELQQKSAKLVYDMQSHTPEYLKVSDELAKVAAEVDAELKSAVAA
jgi:hypothetical protein